MAKHTTREGWLLACVEELRGLFAAHGYARLPKVRVACGWPSKRATSRRNQRIGECWSNSCSADGHFEILISPVVADPMRVADVLVHELVHAAVGTACGHKGPFKQLARAVGLEGKLTATVAGEQLRAELEAILKRLGDYPHGALTPSRGQKKQATFLLKVECGSCGYIARVTAKWLELGAPLCPCNGEPMEVC